MRITSAFLVVSSVSARVGNASRPRACLDPLYIPLHEREPSSRYHMFTNQSFKTTSSNNTTSPEEYVPIKKSLRALVSKFIGVTVEPMKFHKIRSQIILALPI